MSAGADVGAIVIQGVAVFAFCIAVHIGLWRVQAQPTFHQWLPKLLLIFFAAGSALAFWLTLQSHPAAGSAATSHGAMLHFAAVFLIYGPLAMVYTIGYTLISAFSPSIELLKFLDAHPGARIDQVDLPYLRTIVGGDRVRNLIVEGMLDARGEHLALGPRSRLLVTLFLVYRRVIGLPDGSGG